MVNILVEKSTHCNRGDEMGRRNDRRVDVDCGEYDDETNQMRRADYSDACGQRSTKPRLLVKLELSKFFIKNNRDFF